MTIEAKIILDSISPQGIRLTTMQLRYPKFIHAEFMTHRVFSRNARSSRAVPVAKILAEVRETPALPVFWGKNQPGMSAAEELDPDHQIMAQEAWIAAGNDAADRAEDLVYIGLHKQTANRILEPWTHIDVLVTSTEWRNFYELRVHPAAQPEMRALAEKMLAAHKASVPHPLAYNQWHLPFGNDYGQDLETAKMVSAARCARISYKPFDGTNDDPDKDVMLAKRLMESGHWSPFEHQASPDHYIWRNGVPESWEHQDEHRNFHGWRQFRAMIDTRISSTEPVIWEGR